MYKLSTYNKYIIKESTNVFYMKRLLETLMTVSPEWMETVIRPFLDGYILVHYGKTWHLDSNHRWSKKCILLSNMYFVLSAGLSE